jgi:hypothetical protein
MVYEIEPAIASNWVINVNDPSPLSDMFDYRVAKQ